MDPREGDLVENKLEELCEAEPVLPPDTEAGDGLTLQSCLS